MAGSAGRRNSPTRRSSAFSGANISGAAIPASAARCAACSTLFAPGEFYDHVGGGFARYSVDGEWNVPHFEKMLYDNAQILELLALAQAETPSSVYENRAHDTFAWLQREMRAEGAFAASLDADQDGEEGLFYVWTAEEIEAALGRESSLFRTAYDVRAGGNWEGRNVLRMRKPVDPALEDTLAPARAKLFGARENSPAPRPRR